jgi:PAS domain-containing protein
VRALNRRRARILPKSETFAPVWCEVLETMPESLLLVDEDGNTVAANGAFRKRLLRDREVCAPGLLEVGHNKGSERSLALEATAVIYRLRAATGVQVHLPTCTKSDLRELDLSP